MKENYYTLESLSQKQQRLHKEIKMSQQRISTTWSQLTTPPEANTKMQHWVNQAERAVAVYDGFMMMYKLIHRFPPLKTPLSEKRIKHHKVKNRHVKAFS